MRKLETFLGLTPARATPRLPVKQHDHALESLVANWADPAIADLPAVVFLWDCCSALDASAPGCAVAPAHAAYE